MATPGAIPALPAARLIGHPKQARGGRILVTRRSSLVARSSAAPRTDPLAPDPAVRSPLRRHPDRFRERHESVRFKADGSCCIPRGDRGLRVVALHHPIEPTERLAGELRDGPVDLSDERAGFNYGDEKQAALSADEVLDRIRKLAVTEGETLRAGDHPIVATGARRHFGGWKAAFEATGCAPPETLTWTKDAVIAAIRDDVAKGLPVNSARIMRRNANLYVAGRRRFGTWAAALIAAKAAPRTTTSGSRRRSSSPR